MFICIEGIDASGKATQSGMLAARIGGHLFSFPDYKTPMGRLIEGHLRRYWHALPIEGSGQEDFRPTYEATERLNAMVFQALQTANRLERWGALKDVLDSGGHVVADRYTPSGIVYGHADGIPLEYMEKLQLGLPQADLYILIDVTAEESVRRQVARGRPRDRYESKAGFMEKVRTLYQQLWERHMPAGNWYLVNGMRPAEEVHQTITQIVNGFHPLG